MIDFMRGVVSDSDIKCLMLHNVLYHRGSKKTNYKDALSIVYTNLRTKEKKVHTIDEPEIEIYFTKEDLRGYNHNKAYAYLDDVYCKRVKYRNVMFEIANEIDGTSQNKGLNNYLKRCNSEGNYAAKKNVHRNRYVFGSDVSIETLYRIYWKLQYENDLPKPISKGFLDIETDIIDIDHFPRNGDCPISMVSLFEDKTNTMYTFCLDIENAKSQIDKFKTDIKDIINDNHELFDDIYGNIDYKVFMYGDERELLIHLFKTINMLKLDYVMIWNGCGFDMPFIIDRFKVLGLDPATHMCPEEFKYKEAYVYNDTRNFQAANKGDYVQMSSYTEYIDQMLLYAAMRKAQSELRSNKLSVIANKEIGDEKLDYHEETSSGIKTLLYDNYKLYYHYNIKDVLLQFGIERKCKDLDSLYIRLMSNVCPTNKAFKQTIFLAGRAYMEFLLQGLIIGNNNNINYGEQAIDKKDGVLFSGALVGNPLNNANNGTLIFGKKSKFVFEYVIDFDFSALYPSIIIAFNISPATMIGKLFVDENPEILARNINKAIDNREKEKDNMKKLSQLTSEGLDDDDDDEEAIDVEDRGKSFVEDYLTGNIPNTGSKWFNLPSITDICKRIDKEYYGL